MDLAILRARRAPKGIKTTLGVEPQPKTPEPSATLAVAANGVLLQLLAKEGPCPLCGGASWLGEHAPECCVPFLQSEVVKSKFFSVKEVTNSTVVHKNDLGQVFIHGIPFERWLHLNTEQRVDCIERRHNNPKVVRITCRYCDKKTYLVTPLKKGQNISTCHSCWQIESMKPSEIKIAAKYFIAKARWAREQVGQKSLSAIMARESARRASAAIKILKAVATK